MQPGDTLLVFFRASVLLALTPGPDNFFVLAQAVPRGKMAGVAVTPGRSLSEWLRFFRHLFWLFCHSLPIPPTDLWYHNFFFLGGLALKLAFIKR